MDGEFALGFCTFQYQKTKTFANLDMTEVRTICKFSRNFELNFFRVCSVSKDKNKTIVDVQKNFYTNQVKRSSRSHAFAQSLISLPSANCVSLPGFKRSWPLICAYCTRSLGLHNFSPVLLVALRWTAFNQIFLRYFNKFFEILALSWQLSVIICNHTE